MSLSRLLATLAAERIAVPGAAEYTNLAAMCGTATSPAPHLPGPLLDLTPADLDAHATAYAAWDTQRNEWGNELRRLSGRLTAEMVDRLREHAETIVDALAVPYTASADAARAVIASGVSPNDNLDELAHRRPEAIPGWLAFQGAHVRTLARLARARADLAALTGEAGLSDRDDLAVLVTRPFTPGLLTPLPGRSLWWPWLNAASNLAMVRVGEIDALDVAAAKGYDVAEIRRALRQAEASTAVGAA